MGRLAGILALALIASGPAAALPRSHAARADFVKIHACPATGQHKTKCPGYQIDHVVPLKCNGADAPANMQWLTIEQHKAKTRAEAKLCRRR